MKMTQQSIQYSYQGEERNLFIYFFLTDGKKICGFEEKSKGRISNHDFRRCLSFESCLTKWVSG